MTTSTRRPLRDYDAGLGPATALTGARPTRVVLAALVRGLALSYPRSTVVAWLKSRRPETKHVLDSKPLLDKLYAAAKQRVADSSTPEARLKAQFEVVRLTITHLLSPAPGKLSAGSAQRARMAVATMCSLILRDQRQWTTVLIDGFSLGVQMGVGRAAATTAVNNAVGAGWLRVVKKVPNGPTRYAVQYAPPIYKGSLWTVAEQVAAVGLLAGAEDVESIRFAHVVQLIQHATHSAWSRHKKDPDHPSRPVVNHLTWLVAFADAMHVDPTEVFGIATRGANAHRRLLRDEIGLSPETTNIQQVLDAFAVRTGVMSAYQEAEANRRLAAAARKVELELARERKAAARSAVGSLLKAAGKVPPTQDAFPDWSRKMAAAFSIDVDDPMHNLVRAELKRRITAAQHPLPFAEVVVDVVAPTRLTPLLSAVGPIPSPDVDAGTRNAWGKHMRSAVDAAFTDETARASVRTDLHRRLKGAGYTNSQAMRFAEMVVRKREPVAA